MNLIEGGRRVIGRGRQITALGLIAADLASMHGTAPAQARTDRAKPPTPDPALITGVDVNVHSSTDFKAIHDAGGNTVNIAINVHNGKLDRTTRQDLQRDVAGAAAENEKVILTLDWPRGRTGSSGYISQHGGQIVRALSKEYRDKDHQAVIGINPVDEQGFENIKLDEGLFNIIRSAEKGRPFLLLVLLGQKKGPENNQELKRIARDSRVVFEAKGTSSLAKELKNAKKDHVNLVADNMPSSAVIIPGIGIIYQNLSNLEAKSPARQPVTPVPPTDGPPVIKDPPGNYKVVWKANIIGTGLPSSVDWSNLTINYNNEATKETVANPQNEQLTSEGLVETVQPGTPPTGVKLEPNETFGPYGRYSATVEIPYGYAIWPSIFGVGTKTGQWPNDGEIDYVEHWNNGNLTKQGIQTLARNWMNGQTPDVWFKIDDKYHTFTTDVTNVAITFYVDGKKTYSTPNDGTFAPGNPLRLFVINVLPQGGASLLQHGPEKFNVYDLQYEAIPGLPAPVTYPSTSSNNTMQKNIRKSQPMGIGSPQPKEPIGEVKSLQSVIESTQSSSNSQSGMVIKFPQRRTSTTALRKVA